MTTQTSLTAQFVSRILARTETRSTAAGPGFIVSQSTDAYVAVDHRADQTNADGTRRTTYVEQGEEVDAARQRYIDALTAAGLTAELAGPRTSKYVRVTR